MRETGALINMVLQSNGLISSTRSVFGFRACSSGGVYYICAVLLWAPEHLLLCDIGLALGDDLIIMQ